MQILPFATIILRDYYYKNAMLSVTVRAFYNINLMGHFIPIFNSICMNQHRHGYPHQWLAHIVIEFKSIIMYKYNVLNKMAENKITD